jgi:Papain-like cysteine protease AvrRpt2
MPYVHRLRRLVRGAYASSRFYIAKQAARAGVIDIPRYHQLDDHSCGFLAALAVVRHFAPETEADEVLRVVAPSPTDGCDGKHLIRYLKRLGVAAVYRDDLGRQSLRRLTAARTPVIVTIEPEEYSCDHWTVVRGLDRTARRIFLTNPANAFPYAAADGSLPGRSF